MYKRDSGTIKQFPGQLASMVLYSNSQPEHEGIVLRRKRDGSQVPVRCLSAVINYKKYMGGVDKGDQLHRYDCRIKSRKFYKYIFYFLFDVSITNAYILYKNYCPNLVFKNIKDFRLELAKELIGDYCTQRRSTQHTSLETFSSYGKEGGVPTAKLNWKGKSRSYHAVKRNANGMLYQISKVN